ncbi:hypothetical protein LuPra_02445 [Luteitalea pratensis]|uniref:Uncharacterized protein n=1 Tax=Luteitalea pratensis TaxID=1855912 RepID=A0A143PKX7_LUTPR|nr:hypothetical protein LuPra_02445 [Luteitalea pratensis]
MLIHIAADPFVARPWWPGGTQDLPMHGIHEESDGVSVGHPGLYAHLRFPSTR